MFMEGDLRTKNLAMALEAEIDAEKQRVEKGIIPLFRERMIRRVLKGAGTVYSPEARKRKIIQMEHDIR